MMRLILEAVAGAFGFLLFVGILLFTIILLAPKGTFS